MPPTDAQRIMAYDAQKKSPLIAYLLWWFLGFFGAHRFYMNQPLSAVFMLLLTLGSMVLTLVIIGWLGLLVVALWWFIDAFLIPGYVRRFNMRLASRLG
ncbi:MAG: hypothetical protein CMJ35_16130 [Phycisphaerae bacterium]|nr:hypothetical protein [Phycisphaerae bacterium]MBM90906.1 hypothetical protein [Phycisphaerae bacterium]MBM93116.1 hypothetical protein [Phycisphaerae bacterium]HCT44681.1 TM2 domain-containing protein [Phycisphaerales bacterium]|tara:strand:+ start:419 stop:715 length:297 start_codon:yes stop_codon:yes gene_type:complete